LTYSNRLIQLDTNKTSQTADIKDDLVLNLSNKQLRIQELEILKDSLIKEKDVKKLDLSNNLFIPQACEKLAFILSHYKQLEYLDLSNNPIRDEGLNTLAPILSKLENLKVLKLNNCRLVNVKNIGKILASSKVNHLEISKNQIELGLNELRGDYLNILIIQENHNIHRRQSLSLAELRKLIAENKNLKIFDISNNQFAKLQDIQTMQHAHPSLQLVFKDEMPKKVAELPIDNKSSVAMNRNP